ncbi:hypothetical protein CY35_18G080700 [Sphagnum magellanicum]|nr:hypothetical protein CY35_18G080700 [Sphagnum magellanicum]
MIELALSSGPYRELFSGKQGNVEQQHPSCEYHQKAGEADCAGHERTVLSGHSQSQGSAQGVTRTEQTPVSMSQPASAGTATAAEGNIPKKDVALRNLPQYSGDEDPQGGGEQKQETGNRWTSSEASKSRSNSSCASSSYNGSGSEDNDESHDAEDDWETAFDALHIQSPTLEPETPHEGPSLERMQHSEVKELDDTKSSGAHVDHDPDHLQGAHLKPEYKYKNSGYGGRRGNGWRAWRPDDVSRPPSLPRLTKQHTFPGPQNGGNSHGWGGMHGNMWGPPSTPSFCPICTEELDMTDSSYIPCSCGFQLCLFCYHRISSDDGRCPGCRKAYNSEVAVKLSRSSSVWLRST